MDRALKLDRFVTKLPARVTRDWASMSTQARIYELIDFLNEVAIDKSMHSRLSYYGPSVAGLTTNEQVQFSIDLWPAPGDLPYDSLNARDREHVETQTLKIVAARME